MPTTVILLLIFGVSIGYATFAENTSGTEHAKNVVYNAKWFELLFLLLIVNLIGSIFRYNLINRRKWSVLLFHLAFICMIIGAAVTRYIGYEGIMHIRQGETSNEISSDKNSVRIIAEYKNEHIEKNVETTFSETTSNAFSEQIKLAGKTITVENELFVPNSIETLIPDEHGEPALSMFVMNAQNQGSEIILMQNESVQVNGLNFSFGDNSSVADIHFSIENNQVYFKSKMPVSTSQMMQKNESVLRANESQILLERTIYKVNNVIFVLKSYLPKASKSLTQAPAEKGKMSMGKLGKDAVIFKVSDGTVTKKINVLSAVGQSCQPAICELNGLKVSVSYGMLQRKLPFSITLRAFELERYSGSNSPSSYASEITVTDNEMKTIRPFRIYMNNILNYRGYRFYQSSYDQDEQGTVLSVNHDFWGTMISYLGYLLMTIGMIWTLLNKNSRFRTVLRLSNELQLKRKAGKFISIILLLAITASAFAASGVSKKDHIEILNSLLIQDAAQGRIEPFSTYSSDLLRKIYKKTSYYSLSATEVILGMSSDPRKWQNEPIIKVANTQLANELGIVTEYISYIQLFDNQNSGAYKLKDLVEKIYQKEQSTQSKYDKEVINVDERVNICSQIFDRNLLAFFPIPCHENQPWNTGKFAIASLTNQQVCPAGMTKMESSETDMSSSTDAKNCPYINSQKIGTDSSVTGKSCPYVGGEPKISEEQLKNRMGSSDLSISINSPELLLTNYYKAVNEACVTGNWSLATDQLMKIKNYQLANGGLNLPSTTRVSLEIIYNKFNIFNVLSYIYTCLGFLLLTALLITIFKQNTQLDEKLKYAFYPFLLVFVLYTAGLVLRWYISGHAPWSNGYESMIFVGWGASLSGLIFGRKSPVSLAITGILSAIALIVAAMSWMNPEITNLVPVLKSYWLIIHVAIITTSYGFLAMGALLGFLNLILMIFKSEKNHRRINFNILEISYLVELALTIGLILLTIGCFIGGVWANESWGRYWGWDSKETWALVSIVIYAAILHLRNIPKLNNLFVLNSLALIGFSSVLMTFLGVNYYLTGMHSYGQGTPPSVPISVYFVGIIVAGIIFAAYKSEKPFMLKPSKNKQQLENN